MSAAALSFCRSCAQAKPAGTGDGPGPGPAPAASTAGCVCCRRTAADEPPRCATVITMIPFVELVWRLVASVLGAVVTADPANLIALAGAAGAVGLIAIVAASVVRSTLAAVAGTHADERLETALEPADRAELLGQSDPDADGRARPRAPGFTLQTA